MITRDYVGPVQHHSSCLDDYLTPGRKGIERRFGEADHALPFWCRVFAYSHKIYVLSVDSDVLANMAVYVSTSDIDLLDNSEALKHVKEVIEGATGNPGDNITRVVGEFLGPHKQLIWVRPDFRPRGKRAPIPFEQIDLLELYHKLLFKEMKQRFPERKSLGEGGAVNCTLFQFLLMCALNGTDYVDKKDVTKMVGADKVIAAVMQHKKPYVISLSNLRAYLQESTPVDRMTSMFPVGDYDPRICEEGESFFDEDKEQRCILVFFSVADLGRPEGRNPLSLPLGEPQLFFERWMAPHKGVAWQLAYWLVNYNLFKPRKSGDPVARYARIKRKSDAEFDAEERPWQRAKCA